MRRRPHKRKKEVVIDVVKNDQIKADMVRLLGEEGGQIGVMPLEEARKIAKEEEVDLILISADAKPPVCKLISFDKFRYQVIKKQQKAKSKQKKTTLKEIRLSANISDNDLSIKQNNARKFLTAGDKVKLLLQFVGREITHSELGKEVMRKMIAGLADIADIEQGMKLDKKNMLAILAPKKKK